MLASHVDPAHLHQHASDDSGCRLVVPSSFSCVVHLHLVLDNHLVVQELGIAMTVASSL